MFDEAWKRAVMEALHNIEDVSDDCIGEHRMYRRVLEQGIRDYASHRDTPIEKLASLHRGTRSEREGVQIYKDAKAWMDGTGERTSLESVAMSLPNVCLVLGVPVDEARKLAQEITPEELHVWERAKAGVSKSESAADPTYKAG